MYYTSNLNGEVFNNKGQKIKPLKKRNGYMYFNRYMEDGTRKAFYIHRFVWEYFNGDIPKNMEIDHIDNDKENNSIENLRVVTRKFNTRRRSTNKLSCDVCKVIKRLYYDKKYLQKEIADEYDIHPSTVSRCINNLTWA